MAGEPIEGMAGHDETDGSGAHRRAATRRVAFVVALAVLTTVAAAARPATADTASPSDQTAYFIGQERADRGVAPLTRVAALDDIAQAHAEKLASRSELYHNPDLAELASPWVELAENVGRGTNIRVVHDGFMASDSHRPHIISPTYTQLGVGVAGSPDGQVYVVHVFRTQSSDTAPPPPPPTTAPPPPPPPAPPPPPPAPAAAADPTPDPEPAPEPVPAPPAPAPRPTVAAPSQPADTTVATASGETIEVALVSSDRDVLPPRLVQVALALLVAAGVGVAHVAARSRRAVSGGPELTRAG